MHTSHIMSDASVRRALRRGQRGMRSACTVITALAVLVAAPACKDITTLEQSNPGQLGPDVFAPQNADLIVNSSRGDLECAFNEYIAASGTFMDELADAISQTANFDLDRRTITPDSPYGTNTCDAQQQAGVYTPLSVARASNDVAVQHLEGWTDEQVPDRSHLIAVASAYGGYSFVFLGEGMCSAAFDLGPEESDQQIFADAMVRFDTAIAAATRANDATTLNLALLGRARTELDLGNSADAATDAALIPPGFEVDIDHDATATRRQNLVFIQTIQAQFASIDTSIQNRFAADNDPRIAVTSTGALGSDGHTVVWFANKDATPTAPQALAKYSEAQLIIAENDVNTGALNDAVTILNQLRSAAGQPAYSGGLTAPAVMADIVEQRRRELFLEGHRLGDIRRLGLPLSPAVGAPYVNGGTYADQSCFPLPNVERINNPNLDRATR
ncbi:MAG TPA: RagB/SusD family nutrient uptake outer membrane protein [Gemmatimonadaceae bacterium]|nr:RagB/SusD family nutrient uptake outer membrane protein [Gemmatimonadaceae bacterium]